MWSSFIALILSFLFITFTITTICQAHSTSTVKESRHLRIPFQRHHHNHTHHQPHTRHLRIDTSLFEHVRKKKHHPSTPPINSTVHISLTNYYSVMYTGDVKIGLPLQHFNMIFDTGSSCLWVLSQHIISKHHSFLHYYFSDISTTSNKLQQPWSIEYGVGTVSGFLTNDTVTLGPLVANGQVFAEATHLSTNFVNENQPMDGILGFAFRGGACARYPTFLDTLHEQGQISHRIFSFYLTRELHAETGSSEMIIGPPDTSLYKTDLIYTPVLHSGHPQMWFVLLEGFSIGMNDMISLSLCGYFDNPCIALPDTGTSFLTVPSTSWSHIINMIIKDRIDCMIDEHKNTFCMEGARGLPNLIFHFRGHQFILTSEDYMLPNNQIAIQTLDFGIPDMDIIILGDVFLRTIYTVFDADELRVGFASARVIPHHSSPYMIVFMSLAGFLCLCFLIDWCRHASRRSEYLPLQ